MCRAIDADAWAPGPLPPVGTRHTGGVDITLLYFDGCPHVESAEDNLRAALDDMDSGDAVGVLVRKQLVETVEEAERVGFLGSPTIVIDGHDPFATNGATPGLSCRVYATEAGLDGIPTVAQLRDALTAATARR